MTDRRKESHGVASRKQKQKKKPVRISIVGAGRLGTFLGRALKQAAYEIPAVITNHAATARRAANLIGSGTVAITAQRIAKLSQPQANLLLNSGVILISTPDDAIAPATALLHKFFIDKTARSPRDRRQRIALHTSGALSSELLKPLRSAGFAVGSMHPLISVANPTSDVRALHQTFFCVEGDRAAVAAARSIARGLGGQSFTIHPASKALYHAAAVLTAGHTVSLIDIAIQMLRKCGLSSQQARTVLLPLIKSTVGNLEGSSTAQALTGTFARADVETVKRHLAAIRAKKLPQALAAYVLLGRHSLGLVKQLGRDANSLDEIDRLLRANSRRLRTS